MPELKGIDKSLEEKAKHTKVQLPEPEGEINKFTETEMILGGGAALIVDGLCAVADLTLVGDFVTPFIQGAVMFLFSLWLWQKGDKQAFKLGKQLAKQASNLVPFLPTVTAVFIIDVIIHNNPKLKKVADVAGGKAGSVKA